MFMKVSFEYLNCALETGARSQGGLMLCDHDAGMLTLPSGQLIAFDPLLLAPMPCKRCVPIGSFPVHLTVATCADSDEAHVAFAAIRFQSNNPVDWQIMQINSPEQGLISRYAVTSGTGAFVDAATLPDLTDAAQAVALIERVKAVCASRSDSQWHCASLALNDANLVLYSTGSGDGAYVSYGGYDIDGQLCAVVTDFRVVPNNERRDIVS